MVKGSYILYLLLLLIGTVDINSFVNYIKLSPSMTLKAEAIK